MNIAFTSDIHGKGGAPTPSEDLGMFQNQRRIG
jgi:hypothetical protein